MNNLLEKAKYLLPILMKQYISEDTVLMCACCRSKSGNRGRIEVTYTSVRRPTGGWNPAWEGRVCVHVTEAQIIEHFGRTALYQAAALKKGA